MSLVEVRFEPQGKTVFVAAGTTLLEASRMAGVDLATGCTKGQCGTDAVHVANDGLAPVEGAELATLRRMGLGEEFRLACSARVARGPLTVFTEQF